MSEMPLANSEAARTETGEIKDLSPPPPPSPTTPTEPETPVKKDLPAPEPEAPKTLLNEKPGKNTGEVPEKYEFSLPEGFNIDEATTKEVDTLFREIGLDQPSAQRLMDLYTTKVKEVAEAPINTWSETRKGWVEEIKNDPALGKRLPEVRQTVARAIDGLGDQKMAQEFRQAMDITGAGDNPAFIRAFYKLAQQ